MIPLFPFTEYLSDREVMPSCQPDTFWSIRQNLWGQHNIWGALLRWDMTVWPHLSFKSCPTSKWEKRENLKVWNCFKNNPMASKLSLSNFNFQIGNKKIPFSSDFSIIMQIQGAALLVTWLRPKAKHHRKRQNIKTTTPQYHFTWIYGESFCPRLSEIWLTLIHLLDQKIF